MQIVTRWILAVLRHEVFIAWLNSTNGSRVTDTAQSETLPEAARLSCIDVCRTRCAGTQALASVPLPVHPNCCRCWLAKDYHVDLEKHYYSASLLIFCHIMFQLNHLHFIV